MRGRLGWTLAGLAACAEGGTSTLWLDLPIPNVASEVVAVSSATRLEVSAISLAVFPVDLGLAAADTKVRVEVVAYSESLEVNGLAPGILVPVGDGNPLPRGEGVFVADIIEGETEGWRKIGDAESMLARLRFGENACPRFRATPLGVEGVSTDAVFAHPLDDGTVLLGFRGGVIARFADGEVALVPTSTVVEVTSIAADPEGGFSFGTSDGRLLRGQFVGERLELSGFVTLSTEPLDEVQGVGVELSGSRIAITGQGVVFREDGGRVTELHDFGAPGLPRSAAIFPEHLGFIAFSEGSSNQVLRIDADGAQALVEVSGSTSSLTAGAHVPGLGPVLVNAEGKFFVLGEPVRELPGSMLRVYADAMAPYGSGFVFGAVFGNVGAYIPEAPGGFCPIEQLAAFPVYAIAPIAGGLLLAGGSTGGSAVVLLSDG
ncbi:MAG: hypothetical protein HYV07_22380 [Deltaproteobacteria bacterium]|nr:hypothetical protein [Deltaproteobacteria bacterium]